MASGALVGIFERLIQAIVGKGLYKQYTQRQTAGEVHAKTDLACRQRYAQTPQTQGLPYALWLGASPISCTRSDATNKQPTDVSGPKSAPARSSLRRRPSSATTLGRSPLFKPIEPTLIPKYNAVHNHCSRITGDLEPGDSTFMQSYEYDPLKIGSAIGFQASAIHRRVRAPPRKVTDLESLPPLSSEVAADFARRQKSREQAGILAEVREAHEKDSENRRRASRAAQMRVPPYVAHIAISYSAGDLEAALLSEPPPTPLIPPKPKQFVVQPDQHLGQVGHHAGDALKQEHVRWAPEPAPQRRRDSTALNKKSRGAKKTSLRNGSKKF